LLKNIVNVMPPEAWWLSYLPLIIVGIVILGVLFLIVFGVLISRRMTITMRTSGAVALTLASVLLLSGLWCMLLSPTSTYPETRSNFYDHISIDGLGNWSYTVNVQIGDTLFGSLDGVRVYDSPADASAKTFSIRVYDPEGNVVWSQTNVTYTYFNVESPKSGVMRVEIRNPSTQAIECNIQVTVSAKVIYRPLEPGGQWLSLISLPVFGFGIWASGLFAIIQKKEKKAPASVYA